MTTPAGRSPRTATSADALPLSRANASSSVRRRLDERQRRVHDLADGPLDDARVAVGAVEQAPLADRSDEPDDVVALGLLRHRHLADAVGLERVDRVADALGRAGDDDRRAIGRVVAVGQERGDPASPRRSSASRPLTRIHSSL